MLLNSAVPDARQAHIVSEWAHDRPLVGCRFDPAGRYVFCAAEHTAAARFSTADGSKTLFPGGHQSWISGFAFSQDGALTVSGGCDGRLTWWDTAAEAPTPIRSIAAHGRHWVRSIAANPAGTLLVSGGNDKMVRVWSIPDGTLVREYVGHQKHIYSVTFDHSGERLLSGDLAGVVKEWDVAAGTEVRTFDAKELWSYNGGQGVDFGGVRALAVSPDGKWLAAGGLYKATNPLGAVHEPIILLFSRETGAAEKKLIAEGITNGVIWRAAWLSDGSIVGVSGGGSGGVLCFWKPDAEKDYFRFALPNTARDMDVHRDGLLVATAHHDRHLRITSLSMKPA